MDTFKNVPFNFRLPEDGGVHFGLIGSGRSGKSTCMIELFKDIFTKGVITVMMSNSSQASIYKDLPKSKVLVSPAYYPKVIKDMALINRETKNEYDFLVILDDVVTGIKFDKELLKLLAIYRNSNLSSIVSVQAVKLLNSAGRTNFTYIFLFKMNSDDQIEAIIRSYLNTYMPKEMSMMEKMRLYKQLTANHYFLVVDNLNGGIYRTRCQLKKSEEE